MQPYRRIRKADRADFASFCRKATDSQLAEIEQRERSAGRRVYAKIAREEATSRGLQI